MKIIKVDNFSENPENFTGIVEWPDGTKSWFKEGKSHREDGPAYENINGNKEWYLEGKWYIQININDYIVLDEYKGKYGLIWYKLLTKDQVFEYPDIPGLIIK